MFNKCKQSACYEYISLTLGWSREHRQSVTAEPNVRVRREIFTKNIKNSANTRHRSMEMGSLLIINSLDLWSDLPQAAKQAGLTNWSTYVDKLEKTQNRICAGMQLEWNLDDDQQLISLCRTYMDFDFLEPFVKKIVAVLFYFPYVRLRFFVFCMAGRGSLGLFLEVMCLLLSGPVFLFTPCFSSLFVIA